MADNQRPGDAGIPRRFGFVLLAEAATLGIASYLHRDGRIPLGFTVIHGEQFASASVPEAVIGAVLVAGAAIVLAAPARARRAAVFAAGFGIVGFVAGTVFVLTSGRPSIAIDLTYHAVLLAALITTMVTLALRRPTFHVLDRSNSVPGTSRGACASSCGNVLLPAAQEVAGPALSAPIRRIGCRPTAAGHVRELSSRRCHEAPCEAFQGESARERDGVRLAGGSRCLMQP